ncbi:Ribonucleoside-diphosphate reductase subunit alpha [Salmonella enterica subsp. enterica serovar Typhimurium str. DT104]|nr:Ribonucleoside-diphosphate reductase subunit alpha [Salmonella enterica subsp. enterica serovar Typhimurium str. DT104]
MKKVGLDLNFDKNQEKSYLSLNANSKIFANHPDSHKFDLLAAEKYINEEINPKFKFFNSFKERIEFLVQNNYYDPKVLGQYSFQELEKLNTKA